MAEEKPTGGATGPALDPDSQAVVDKLGLKTWTPKEKDDYLDGSDAHPLFMDKAPTLEEASSNEYVSAMQAMAYDEDETPEMLAAEAKDKGNKSFSKGKAFYGNALRHYKEALDHCLRSRVETEEMVHLQSVVRANIAAILLARNKLGEVVFECGLALELWPGNFKAAFRAGKASLALGKVREALNFCGKGLAVKGDNKSLLRLKADAQRVLDVQAKREAESAARKKEREAMLAAVKAGCVERGIKVGFPLYSRPTPDRPYVDAAGSMVWPVLFLYPEYSETDFVSAFPEVTTFREQLSVVLPDSGPPPTWDDTFGSYRVSNIKVLMLTNMGKPRPLDDVWLDDDEDVEPTYAPQEWFEVPLDAPLLLPLVHPQYVMCDMPVFTVVAKGTERFAEFMAPVKGTLAVPELPSRPDA